MAPAPTRRHETLYCLSEAALNEMMDRIATDGGRIVAITKASAGDAPEASNQKASGYLLVVERDHLQ